LPTWPTQATSEETSDDWNERPPYRLRQQDSPDQEASPRNSGYTVEFLDGSRVVKAIQVEDRTDAVSLAYDMMQFAATSYNAIGNRQGSNRLTPERTQFTELGANERAGDIVVEWSVIPDGTSRYQAARVTVGTPSGNSEDSGDSEDGPEVVFILV
jgi:hypothetical protein